MALHHVLRIKDLPHSDKITFLDDEDATVAHVVAIKEEAAAAAEATPTAAEPEVAKKGKPDAEKKPEAKK